MTDIDDFAQLAALQAERLNAVEAAFYAAGFAVRSVSPHMFGYRVNLDGLTWAQKTITDHVTSAGYDLRRYGCDRDGIFLIVNKCAKEVQE